jgi:SAM-dependent methyltransferase
VKLNLGCSDRLLDGFINIDITPGPGIQVADLRFDWPWPDRSVELVVAHDIIEHLPDKIHTMNELHRVLMPGGKAEIIVPTTDGPGAFQDPTHVSYWHERSFLYYEDGNPYRERFAASYGIRARFRTVHSFVELTSDGPKLFIVLEAIHSTVELWAHLHRPVERTPAPP